MVFDDKSLAPYHGGEPYLFLSYSHRNAQQAARIIRRLNQLHFRVWYDEGLIPGREWDESIARVIMGCSYFVALISSDYLASSNCRDELNYARDKDKPLLLIYLEDVALPAGMELRLGRIFAIHQSRYPDESAFYTRFFDAEAIERCCAEVPVGIIARKKKLAEQALAQAEDASWVPGREFETWEMEPSDDELCETELPVKKDVSKSHSSLQVFGIILLLTLIAGAAILLYYLFGSSPVQTPPAPTVASQPTPTPELSSEAELEIEPSVTELPVVTTPLDPTPTPDPSPTPEPTLPPTPIPTPESDLVIEPDPSPIMPENTTDDASTNYDEVLSGPDGMTFIPDTAMPDSASNP